MRKIYILAITFFCLLMGNLSYGQLSEPRHDILYQYDGGTNSYSPFKPETKIVETFSIDGKNYGTDSTGRTYEDIGKDGYFDSLENVKYPEKNNSGESIDDTKPEDLPKSKDSGGDYDEGDKGDGNGSGNGNGNGNGSEDEDSDNISSGGSFGGGSISIGGGNGNGNGDENENSTGAVLTDFGGGGTRNSILFGGTTSSNSTGCWYCPSEPTYPEEGVTEHIDFGYNPAVSQPAPPKPQPALPKPQSTPPDPCSELSDLTNSPSPANNPSGSNSNLLTADINMLKDKLTNFPIPFTGLFQETSFDVKKNNLDFYSTTENKPGDHLSAPVYTGKNYIGSIHNHPTDGVALPSIIDLRLLLNTYDEVNPINRGEVFVMVVSKEPNGNLAVYDLKINDIDKLRAGIDAVFNNPKLANLTEDLKIKAIKDAEADYYGNAGSDKEKAFLQKNGAFGIDLYKSSNTKMDDWGKLTLTPAPVTPVTNTLNVTKSNCNK